MPGRWGLASKLILAFVLVSLTVAALGAAISRWLTEAEFSRLVVDQARNRFIAMAASYYQAAGSWEGILEYLQGTPSHTAPLEPRPGLPFNPPFNRPPGQPVVYVLTDADGRVVVPASTYSLGEILPESELSQAAAVEVGGQVVGYALATGRLPELDLREQAYLRRTDLALLYAASGAVAVAALLGIWLSRSLTRPLVDLTAAIRRMAGGELEQRVDVRSGDELGQLGEAFNQMSAALARLNRQRRQMTADIAHDLRTPLTVIAGYIEALRDQALQPSPERFATIYIEVQHLQRLIEDLRTLSLADAGELALHRQPVYPQALLTRMAAAFQQKTAEQGVELGVEAAPDLPELQVDEERMVEVLGNLVHNALRHTPPGGKIVLGAAKRGDGIELRVEDSGEGIPAEALPYIFDRFYRADPSRRSWEGESGLGLAIARSIVEAHGGRIEVESQEGKGSVFKILFL